MEEINLNEFCETLIDFFIPIEDIYFITEDFLMSDFTICSIDNLKVISIHGDGLRFLVMKWMNSAVKIIPDYRLNDLLKFYSTKLEKIQFEFIGKIKINVNDLNIFPFKGIIDDIILHLEKLHDIPQFTRLSTALKKMDSCLINLFHILKLQGTVLNEIEILELMMNKINT